MFSELAKPAADIAYSGMSGGPIFWSDDQENFGLMGIVYEGGAGDNGESIYVYGELAAASVVKQWLANVPRLT